MGDRSDSDLDDEKKDDIEYKTKATDDFICELRKASDDTEVKKPQIRFQNQDESGILSDSEISEPNKTKPRRGIFRFFKSRGVHHGNKNDFSILPHK